LSNSIYICKDITNNSYFKRYVDQIIKLGIFYEEIGLNKKINVYNDKQNNGDKESYITLKEGSEENRVIPFEINDKIEEVHMQNVNKDPEVIEFNESKNTRPKRNIVKPSKFKDFIVM
jgi:hypothetical protein